MIPMCLVAYWLDLWIADVVMNVDELVIVVVVAVFNDHDDNKRAAEGLRLLLLRCL